jgi:hypothetical protein
LVDDEREVHHQACGVALAVGAGVRLVWGHTVEGEKLVVAITVDEDAAAGAFQGRGKVLPAADGSQINVLVLIQVDRDRVRQ